MNEPVVSVADSDSDVRIRVSLPDLTQDPSTTAVLAFAAASRAEVGLAEPINGRGVTGPGRALADGELHTAAHNTIADGDSILVAVPRVVGLYPDDAAWVLRAQGFEPIVVGGGKLIRAQTPSPGRGAAGPSRARSWSRDDHSGRVAPGGRQPGCAARSNRSRSSPSNGARPAFDERSY